jgi:hypothetical protein
MQISIKSRSHDDRLPSIVARLFRIRRSVAAAIRVLRDCGHVERQLRLAALLANVGAADGKLVASTRGATLVKRWRAQDAIIRAGADLILACIAIDKSSLTVREKLDLLGCRHRYWVQPTEVEFARLVGGGAEVAPLDFDGTPDPRSGLLRMAAVAILNSTFLYQHDVLRPVVEALEARESEQQSLAAATMRGSVLVDGPRSIQ